MGFVGVANATASNASDEGEMVERKVNASAAALAQIVEQYDTAKVCTLPSFV